MHRLLPATTNAVWKQLGRILNPTRFGDGWEYTTTFVGWVPDPEGRGTIGLLVSCLSTLFICVWTSLHLNVPNPRLGEFGRIRRKLRHMFFAVLVPEFPTTAADADILSARRATRKLRDDHGLRNWTMAHSFLARMGGVSFQNDTYSTCPLESRCAQRAWVDASDIVACEERGALPPELRELTEDDIADRSKADGLIKVIACLQILWFIAQCIGRAAQGLHLAALEIATPAYVLCALLNFSLWYRKPHDVNVSMTVRYQCVRPDGSHASMPARRKWLDSLEAVMESDSQLTEFRYATICMGLFSVFGAIHCAAWNSFFPTEVEKHMWRIASLISAGAPLAELLFIRTEDRTGFFNSVEKFFMWLIIGLYLVARVFLIAEMFISLRLQPADCYQSVEWSKYLPHVG